MARVPLDFLDRVHLVVDKAKSLDLAALNEANTKALLIEPVLAALGWDVTDLGTVTREYKVYDGTFLDYALMVDSKAVLFCEAKPTGKNLDDSKWVSQTINYANNEGVVWCVLTDGLRWRVFKANEAVSMPKKLAFEISLEDVADPARRVAALHLFSCLTPAAVVEGDLSALGTQIFVDGRVREALSKLVEDPSKRFLDVLRTTIGHDVSPTPAELRATLSRAASAVSAALASPAAADLPAAPPVPATPPTTPSRRPPAAPAPSAAPRSAGKEASYAERLAKWPVAAEIDKRLHHVLQGRGYQTVERRLYWTIHSN